MKHHVLSLVACLLSLLVPTSALAGELVEPAPSLASRTSAPTAAPSSTPTDAPSSNTIPAPFGRRTRLVSITTVPTTVVYGMGTLGVEGRLARVPVLSGHPSMDVTLGAWLLIGMHRSSDGSTPGRGDLRYVWESRCEDTVHCDRLTTVWAGAQALAYPVGNFDHGLQVGVEASFIRTSGTRRASANFVSLAGGAVPDESVARIAFLPGIVIGYKLATEVGFTFNPQLGVDLVVGDGSGIVLPRLALNVGWSF